MTIERLIKVAPPPANPDYPFVGPWEPIEADLGFTLPQDYKDLVRLYGSGSFMEGFGINVPRCRSPYVRLKDELHSVRQALLGDVELAYPLWPDPGGLIVFGRTDFGDYLFWRPQGPPDDWRVVVWGRGMQEFEAFDCGLTDFIAGVITGEIQPDDFPEYEPPDEPVFRPYSNWDEPGGRPPFGDVDEQSAATPSKEIRLAFRFRQGFRSW